MDAHLVYLHIFPRRRCHVVNASRVVTTDRPWLVESGARFTWFVTFSIRLVTLRLDMKRCRPLSMPVYTSGDSRAVFDRCFDCRLGALCMHALAWIEEKRGTMTPFQIVHAIRFYLNLRRP